MTDTVTPPRFSDFLIDHNYSDSSGEYPYYNWADYHNQALRVASQLDADAYHDAVHQSGFDSVSSTLLESNGALRSVSRSLVHATQYPQYGTDWTKDMLRESKPASDERANAIQWSMRLTQLNTSERYPRDAGFVLLGSVGVAHSVRRPRWKDVAQFPVSMRIRHDDYNNDSRWNNADGQRPALTIGGDQVPGIHNLTGTAVDRLLEVAHELRRIVIQNAATQPPRS